MTRWSARMLKKQDADKLREQGYTVVLDPNGVNERLPERNPFRWYLVTYDPLHVMLEAVEQANTTPTNCGVCRTSATTSAGRTEDNGVYNAED